MSISTRLKALDENLGLICPTEVIVVEFLHGEGAHRQKDSSRRPFKDPCCYSVGILQNPARMKGRDRNA